MPTRTDVELILAAQLHQVFVAANAICFQAFIAQLFVLIGHQVHAWRRILNGCLLTVQIENSDFGIGTPQKKRDFGYDYFLQ